MARRDINHQYVKSALEREGWEVTDDPFFVRIGRKSAYRYYTDMDTIKNHKALVRKMLTEIANHFRQSNRWEIIEAFDEEHGQYLLFTDGWQGEKREYGCFLHVEVKPDGKIWLRRDGTDLDFGQQLLDEGIAKSSLVLAFHSPRMRELSDFATA